MSTTPEQDYIEQDNVTDNIRSAHAELQRIKDYANEDLFPVARLEALYVYWNEESTNPIRSPRNRLEASKLALHQLFEIYYRDGMLDRLEDNRV